jgi:SpoVK/Ycf46/Vps4 family AAA+-type ATPase
MFNDLFNFGLTSDHCFFQALCTEAALNAIQRRYPQVYKSNDRLLLKPETIGVGLRDFMISIKSNYFPFWFC